MKWVASSLIAALLLAALSVYMAQKQTSPDLEAVFTSCLSLPTATETQSCLRKAIPPLLAEHSVPTLMTYISASSSPSAILKRCHVIAHTIGEQTYQATKSLETTLGSCTTSCGNGCIHGAIAAEVAATLGESYLDENLAHANAEKIKQIGAKYCEQNASLCHGIGHIARISSDSLEGSLMVCGAVATGDALNRCERGALMEDSGEVPFVPREESTVPPDYGYPCNQLPEKYGRACYLQLHTYQQKLFAARSVPKADQESIVKETCSSLSGMERIYCYFGAGYSTNAENGLSLDTSSFCATLSGDDRLYCIEGVAFGYVSYAKYGEAIAYCDARPMKTGQAACFRTAFTYMGLTPVEIKTQCTIARSTVCAQELAAYTNESPSL